MNYLVLGPNGSGKSAFAETLAARLSAAGGGELFYIATMEPFGDEGRERVERHLARRAGMGFTTIELGRRVAQARVQTGSVVLLEDVSNLLANDMFKKGEGSVTADSPESVERDSGLRYSHYAARRVLADIIGLCDVSRDAVIVSICGLRSEDGSNEETRRYIEELNAVNDRLFCFADAVARMADGKPEYLKGGDSDLGRS